jgi:hypothetical protein
MNPIIIGAGMAGLIAACKFTQGLVIDAASESNKERHRALLRFRNEEVSHLTGIPFKRVEVQKAVYSDESGLLTRDRCPLHLANRYSVKVSAGIAARSILDLSPSVRYVAPEDFYEQLLAKVGDRVTWDTPATMDVIDQAVEPRPIISTMPMPAMLKLTGIEFENGTFGRRDSAAAIMVHRFNLKVNCDVYQTVYFTDFDTPVYRASLTGDVLIIERLVKFPEVAGFTQMNLEELDQFDLDTVCHALGLERDWLDMSTHEKTVQSHGKIVPLEKAEREAYMYELTTRHNVYSLGRFATWRNVLLDDLVDDLDVIEKLMRAANYGANLYMARRK